MNIEIANKLQKLRKENGYSQEELADKLGISRQAVSKWERAESSPDTDNLIILAKLYNVSLDELLSTDESIDEIRENTIESKNNSGVCLTDDEGQTLKIENNKIHCYDKDGNEVKFNKKLHATLAIIDSVITLAALIVYLVWSFMTNDWHITWVTWLYMPVVMSIFEAILKKQLTKFLYPVLVTAIYCHLGMTNQLWHPLWILFITIPVFYVICDPIDKYVFKTKELDEDEKD